MSLEIRRATCSDQNAIIALVRNERLNPHGLGWQNFVVATEGGRLIGAAQIRVHSDGARELGSLVVVRDKRGNGLAGRMIDALLAEESGPVSMVTGKPHAPHYARWGFHPVAASEAPRRVRRNYMLGQFMGGVHAVLTRRPVNRLVILVRTPALPLGSHEAAQARY